MLSYGLIGGKDPANVFDFTLESEMIKACGFIRPKILFIPFAALNKKENFIRMLKDYDCELHILEDLRAQTVEEEMNWADVVYFGGGDSKKLISLSSTTVYESLKLLKNTNKLIVGISAGAIALCEAGMGDRDSFNDNFSNYNYKMVEGLKILPYIVCPHYNHAGLDCFNDVVKNYDCDALALEDETAVLLVAEKITVFKTDKSRSVYQFIKKQGSIMKALY